MSLCVREMVVQQLAYYVYKHLTWNSEAARKDEDWYAAERACDAFGLDRHVKNLLVPIPEMRLVQPAQNFSSRVVWENFQEYILKGNTDFLSPYHGRTITRS